MKIYLLYPDSQVPTYAHVTDSGMDLYAYHPCLIPPNEWRLIDTGIAISQGRQAFKKSRKSRRFLQNPYRAKIYPFSIFYSINIHNKEQDLETVLLPLNSLILEHLLAISLNSILTTDQLVRK